MTTCNYWADGQHCFEVPDLSPVVAKACACGAFVAKATVEPRPVAVPTLPTCRGGECIDPAQCSQPREPDGERVCIAGHCEDFGPMVPMPAALTKPESAEKMRKRLGWPDLTESQKRENLEHNLAALGVEAAPLTTVAPEEPLPLPEGLPSPPEARVPFRPGRTTLNRHGFQELIRGNLEWLEAQPRTLERDHIIGIVKESERYYYETAPAEPGPAKPCEECGPNGEGLTAAGCHIRRGLEGSCPCETCHDGPAKPAPLDRRTLEVLRDEFRALEASLGGRSAVGLNLAALHCGHHLEDSPPASVEAKPAEEPPCQWCGKITARGATHWCKGPAATPPSSGARRETTCMGQGCSNCTVCDLRRALKEANERAERAELSHFNIDARIRAEVSRELDAAHADVERLQGELAEEREAVRLARAEVERLTRHYASAVEGSLMDATKRRIGSSTETRATTRRRKGS